MQQTLLKAHENLEGFRGKTDAELQAWLRAILAQQLAMIARKRGRRTVRTHSLEAALEQSSARLESLAGIRAVEPQPGRRCGPSGWSSWRWRWPGCRKTSGPRWS